MAARAVGTVTVSSTNLASSTMQEESTPGSSTVYTNLRRSDQVRLVFTNSGTSTNKLVITPLISGVFTTNSAQTITGSGNYTFTISSSASLGTQSGPVLKVEAQNSSGTTLSEATDYLGNTLPNPSYVYLDIHAVSSGTVYPYSISVASGGKGLPQNTIVSWAGSGSDPRVSNVQTISTGDVVQISAASSGISYFYQSSDTDYPGPYTSLPYTPFYTSDFVFQVFPSRVNLGRGVSGDHSAGSVVAFVTLDMTTDGTTAGITCDTNDFNTAPGTYLFKITGDGTPNAFSDTTTSVAAANTDYTQTFTVSGLATGKKAVFYVRGGPPTSIKVGSGSFVDAVVAGNNEVLTIKGRSSANYDLGKRFAIVGMNADGAYVESTWIIEAPTLDDDVYGIEFFNSSGTKLLSVNDRAGRFVAQNTVTFTNHANSTSKTETVTFANVTNDDEWRISAWIDPDQTVGGAVVNDITKNNGSFDITTYNYSGSTVTYDVTYQIFYAG